MSNVDQLVQDLWQLQQHQQQFYTSLQSEVSKRRKLCDCPHNNEAAQGAPEL